jgi:hypothetical protein
MVGCGGTSSPSMVSTQDPTGVGPAMMEVNNLSAESIYYIYMSPSAQSTWGTDLLDSSVLYVGSTFTITSITAGYWDIRVVDSSGNYKEFYNNYFEAGGYYWVDVTSDGWYR